MGQIISAALMSIVFLSFGAAGQTPAPPPVSAPQGKQDSAVQEPPEEDLSAAQQQVYVLNPLQSAKELKIGNYYLKRGSFKAAVRRFEEAAKWDPNSSEAFLRLGEAEAKLGDNKASKEAFEKYLKLQPDGKQADVVRKKLNKQ